MTVKELIELLKQFDENLKVNLMCFSGSLSYFEDIINVTLNKSIKTENTKEDVVSIVYTVDELEYEDNDLFKETIQDQL